MNIKRFKRFLAELLKPDGHDDLHTPDSSAEFALLYEHLPIGRLSLENGTWKFQYTVQFKKQSEVKPLPDFPDVEKMYQSETLWPFFAFRIPGMNQPQVKQLVKEKGITEGDVVKLLDLFGCKSINNPFELELKNN
jgi:HipA-like protein